MSPVCHFPRPLRAPRGTVWHLAGVCQMCEEGTGAPGSTPCQTVQIPILGRRHGGPKVGDKTINNQRKLHVFASPTHRLHPQSAPRLSCPEEECLGRCFHNFLFCSLAASGELQRWRDDGNCCSLSPHSAILKVLLFLFLLPAHPVGRGEVGGRSYVCPSHLCVPGRVSGNQYWWEMDAPSPTWRLCAGIPGASSVVGLGTAQVTGTETGPPNAPPFPGMGLGDFLVGGAAAPPLESLKTHCD